MDTSTIFGLLTVSIVLLALSSDNHVLQKLGMVLIVAWASTNMAVEWLGFVRAPLVIPSTDAVFAIATAAIGYANRSRVAMVVFVLYVLVGGVHIAGFVLHVQSTYGYYATLNILFLAQLLTVGAAGGWMALCRWADWRDKRLRLDPSRG